MDVYISQINQVYTVKLYFALDSLSKDTVFLVHRNDCVFKLASNFNDQIDWINKKKSYIIPLEP